MQTVLVEVPGVEPESGPVPDRLSGPSNPLTPYLASLALRKGVAFFHLTIIIHRTPLKTGEMRPTYMDIQHASPIFELDNTRQKSQGAIKNRGCILTMVIQGQGVGQE